MDHLDKLIPLAILGVVGAFVLFVLRRAARDRAENSPMRVEVPAEPVNVAEPVAAKVLDPVVVVVQQSVPQETSEIPSAAKAKREDEIVVAANQVTAGVPHEGPQKSEKAKRKKRAPTSAAPMPPAATPILTVMGLLQEKDSLTAAFLLHEILAPPVSRRH